MKNLMVKHMKLRKNKKGEKKRKKRSKKSKSESVEIVVDASNDNRGRDVGEKKSPTSRVAEVAGDFLGSVVEGHQRSSYLRRVQAGDDQPLEQRRHKMSRSKSELSHHSQAQAHKRSGSSTDDKNILHFPTHGSDRSESRFSYNLNK